VAEQAPAPTRAPVPRFVAWLLVAPAALLLLLSYGWPTVDLLYSSLFANSGRGGGWGFIFSSPFLSQLGHALSYALFPMLLLATVAPAFAWAASRVGLAGRWVARAALALPLAVFAPTGLALLWINEHREGASPGAPTDWDGRIVMLATLGAFLFAVPVTCYLAALRRCERRTPTGPAFAVVGVALALAAIGFAVQQYTFVSLVDNAVGNQGRSGAGTPMTVLDGTGGDPRWAPVAVTMLLILAVLGVAAALILLRSGLRMEFDPTVRSVDDGPAPAGPRRLALAGTAAGVVALLVFIVLQLGPWLSGVATGTPELPAEFGALSVFTSTWLIPLGTALVQVLVAALAGFGIAVGRPFGRHSEWLLLAFAPWLFVGNGLLELPRLSTETEGLQPLIAYAPPSWLGIPALFLFTLLFRGQAGHWGRSRATGQPYAFIRTMWPVLPMAVLATGVAWLIQAQDLVVPTLADAGQGVVPNAQLILSRSALPSSPEPEPALGYPLAMLVLFTLGTLVLQWAYLDRIAVRVGRR
jgi:hypothetical protein